MAGDIFSVEDLESLLVNKLESDSLENNLKDISWEWAEVSPEDVILASNIRDIETESVLELAMNIYEVGQLQPCIGDIVGQGEEKIIRLIAGQHRYHAIKYLCESGFPRNIVIRVANRELSNEEVLSVQMSENLQNKMTSEEDAKIIHSFWKSSQEIYGEDNISISYLARKMGRSPRKVSDSIKYVEELSPKVQKMVNTGVLSYSTALLLAKLDKLEKASENGDYYSEQVRTAMFLISKKYTTKQAEKYLKKKFKENELAGPLFTNEVWEEIKTNGYKIAIKDQSSKEGRAAAGWFVRMNNAISILEQPHKAEFSEAIKKAMSELNISLDQFYSNLEQMGVKLD
jgi:ParB/RepB/Spo0J family partition protein